MKTPQGEHMAEETNRRHVPVLLQIAIRILNVRRGGVMVDATLGYAGHASEIARRLGPEGKLIGFDRDPEAMELAKARLEALREELGERDAARWCCTTWSFRRPAECSNRAEVDGLLADFGVSSMQFDEAHRGFSFQADGNLDMRMNPRAGGDRRTSGKSGRGKRTRRSDLRIRRGKEVAENRQSHCQGAADNDDGGIGQSRCGRGPTNETERGRHVFIRRRGPFRRFGFM